MAISTVDHIVDAKANYGQYSMVNKASIANQTAGGLTSLWRATGAPAQGAIPSTVAVCTNALSGSMDLSAASSGLKTHLLDMDFLSSVNATDVYLMDRLCHIGGLSGVLTSAQTVALDAGAVGLNTRRGRSSYYDVQPFLEVYSDLGATTTTCAVNITYSDNSTTDLVSLTIPATLRGSRLIPVPRGTASGGMGIRKINTATLAATTGTAGNFGFTFYRQLGRLFLPSANKAEIADWQTLIQQIEDDCCLQMVVIPSTTASGILIGSVGMGGG